MITEETYRAYIADFNAACDGDGTGFDVFFDKWYAADATFEYIPKGTVNAGKTVMVAFWKSVHAIMHERIQEHTFYLASDTGIATQAPIDFRCKQDVDWVGAKFRKGESFRLMMAAFYRVCADNTIASARVYSIYHPAYQIGAANA